MVWWMQYQVFVPILALQFLQIFWYVLILRIAYRYVRFPARSCTLLTCHSISAIFDFGVDDERSDDEDDGKDD